MIKLNTQYYTFDKTLGFIDIVETKDSPINDDLQTRVKSIPNGWTMNRANAELFETREEAIAAQEVYENAEIEKINNDIHSIEDLIRFSLYSNSDMPIVERAVRQKAKDLNLDSSKI